MSIDVDCEGEIKASPAECLAVAIDASRWMDWARDLEQVDVITPFAGERPMRVTITIEILGVRKSATVDLAADHEANAITFELVESPSLSAFSGGVWFGGQGSRSRMKAQIRADLIRHKTARIERMASRKIETALTRDFVRFVERAHRAR